MAGKHRARTTARRHTEAYALLGTGAITLGLGVALTTGTGVAAADSTNSSVSGSSSEPLTKTITTTVSAQSVNTSTYGSAPGAETGPPNEEQGTSISTTRDSVVREQNPAVTGDNNPGPAPTLAETLIGAGQNDQGLTSGIPGLNAAPDIPFIELGGGGGGLLQRIAGALGF